MHDSLPSIGLQGAVHSKHSSTKREDEVLSQAVDNAVSGIENLLSVLEKCNLVTYPVNKKHLHLTSKPEASSLKPWVHLHPSEWHMLQSKGKTHLLLTPKEIFKSPRLRPQMNISI